jgi:formate/nitrite transporter
MSVNTPRQLVEIAGKIAVDKSKLTFDKTLVLSFLAGAYIALGGLLSLLIGGGIPGIAAENPGISRFLYGAAFPVGLMLVVLAGAELFTGNNAYFIPAAMNRKVSWWAVLKNWGVVYAGNFVGALFVVYFLTHLTGVVSKEPWIDSITQIAIAKTSNPFYVTFLKGIGANWLVCLAVWLGMSAKQTSGKILGLWWPVMAFVAFGFEHSVANMFFLPLAIFEGAPITWGMFVFDNMIAATLGNIVGGGFFVGGLYWYVYEGGGKGAK